MQSDAETAPAYTSFIIRYLNSTLTLVMAVPDGHEAVKFFRDKTVYMRRFSAHSKAEKSQLRLRQDAEINS